MTSSKLEDLKKFITDDDRVCPNPTLWADLHRIMKTAASKENVSEKILNPLILAGWHASTDAEKRNRLIEHVEFSEKHGFLEETNSFLRSLSDEDWHRCPEEELNATSSMDLMMKDYED